MSDLEVDIILMSLQLDPELPPPAQCWLLLSLLTSAPELDTVDTARSSWPRSTPRKEHRSFLVLELQTEVLRRVTERAPTKAISWLKAATTLPLSHLRHY